MLFGSRRLFLVITWPIQISRHYELQSYKIFMTYQDLI